LAHAAFSHRRAILSAALALLAAMVVLILCRTGFIVWLQYAFVFLPDGPEASLREPPIGIAALLIGLSSLAAALLVDRLGARGAFPYLGGGFIGFAIVSLIASNFYSLDILFTPMALGTALTVLVVQAERVWSIDLKLTQTLLQSTSRLSLLHSEEARSRLSSGLKLLDLVLSPKEAIVFQCDSEGELLSAARLRASSSASLDTSRNSTWREGLNLCKRAIKAGEITTQKLENEDAGTNVALPLRHENHTLGALLIRLGNEFNDDDRALLLAIGARLARNLQRQEMSKSAASTAHPGYLSVDAGER
jgi:hypothetical protein